MSSHNNIPVLVLSLEEAESLKVFGMERESAKNLIKVIRQNKSKLELDNLTKADGNCMVTGIIQQCQRVYPHLPAQIQNLVEGPITLDMVSNFRFAVRQFVFDNQSLPEIQNLRSFLTENWDQYWDKMCKNGEWGDQTFLTCTARFLGANILVVRRSLSTEATPYTLIPGRDLNAAGDSSDSLILGFTGTTGHPDNHYQSLLPATRQDIFSVPVFDFVSGPTSKPTKQQQKKKEDRERMKNVRARTNARKVEPKVPSPEEDKAALKREKERKKKAAQRERKKAENLELYKAKHNESIAKSRAAKRAEDLDLYKANDNKFQAKCRAAQRDKDEINLKRKQNEEKDKSRQAERKKDYKKTKTDQNNHQTKSRAKRKDQHGTDRPVPGKRAAKKKKVEDANDRVRNFRVATMIGDDFICVS